MTLPAISYTTARKTFALPPISRPAATPRAAKYPFATMAVGAILIFNTPTVDARREVRGYLASVVSARKMRFRTRTLPDGRLAVERLSDRTPKRAYNTKSRFAVRSAASR